VGQQPFCSIAVSSPRFKRDGGRIPCFFFQLAAGCFFLCAHSRALGPNQGPLLHSSRHGLLPWNSPWMTLVPTDARPSNQTSWIFFLGQRSHLTCLLCRRIPSFIPSAPFSSSLPWWSEGDAPPLVLVHPGRLGTCVF